MSYDAASMDRFPVIGGDVCREVAVRKVLSAVLIIGVMTGCGSGGSGGRADTVQNQPTARDKAGKSVHTTFKTLTLTQIKHALLRLSDMPTGYTVDTSNDDNTNTPSGCKKLDLLDTYDQQFAIKASDKFKGGELGPYVGEDVGVTQGAKSLYSRFADAVKSCHSFRTKNDDGTYATATFAGLSFPKFGDQTFAAQLKVAPIQMVGAVYVDFVLVRMGNVLMLLDMAQVAASPDGATVEGLTRTAATRLQNA